MRDYPAKKFSFSLYDRQHIQNLAKQAARLDKIFKDAIAKGTKIGEASGFCNPDGEFMFDNYPALKDRVEKFFTALHDNLLLTITEGNREEWLLAAAKNSAMVDAYYKKAKKKYGQQAEEWTERHMEGLKAFNNRVERGMNLSDRVWKTTKQFKQELELALELGLGEGKSAAVLSKDVRQYLNEPHKLFRRVRDKKGQLRLSKAAAAYHPGTGVYRSSYRNALRLTATENNIAYRTSDYDRWQQMDFVTGIQIKLSNNHTLNGKPFVDICDHLKGYYPKDFKFVGWHPFCRCIAVPKLADEDEFIERQQALIDGDPAPDKPYSGEITSLPQNFTNWVEENAEKIETARSKPYFIQDNRNLINGIIKPETTINVASVNWFDGLIDKTKAAFLSEKCPSTIAEKIIRMTVNKFATSNPTLFNGGFAGLVVKRGGGGEFMHNSRQYYTASGKRAPGGNTICIRNNTINVIAPDGKTIPFNPFQEVRGALRAIAKKETMTFNQEYSLESLWHEILHAAAPGWNNLKTQTQNLTGAMETANQFCARHSYGSFVAALGGKPGHTAEIIKSGYGYSWRLTNFHALLKAKKISEATAFKELNTALKTKHYEDIEATMISMLEKNGVEKTKATDLIQKLWLKSDDYLKLL